MDLEYARPDVEAAILRVRSRAELDAAMAQVCRLSQDRQLRQPGIYGAKLYVRWLDKLIPHIAKRVGLVDVPQPPKSNERIVVLATLLRQTGGHSQVVKDIMHAFPGQVTSIFTDTYRELPPDLGEAADLGTEYKERAWLMPARRLILDRAVEVYMMLKAIQPTRILLFGHPMDVVPILAAWPFRQVAEFVHHADHIPAVGATLPFSSHVDLTYRCHLACREAGLDAVFAGMTAPIVAPSAPRSRRDGELVIATCGSPNKFRGAGAYTWADYFTAALQAEPNSRIVHIGPVTEDVEAAIAAGLKRANQDPARYRITGLVPSLQSELLACGADVYLSSYPESGGKANLEAMAAHLPMILPMDANAPPLIRFDHPLRRWISVSTPKEIPDAIKAALAMADELRGPERVAELNASLRRFERFVREGAAGLPAA